MPTVTAQQAVELALQHQRAGRLGEAEALYRQILAVQPNHPEAWHQMGLVACAVGRLDLAVQWMGRAVLLQPNRPELHFALGNALARSGRIDEAEGAYRRALEIAPDRMEPLVNLANVLVLQGRLEEAVAAYRRAIDLRPQDAALLSCLIFLLPFCPATTGDAVHEEQAQWNRLFVWPIRPEWKAHENSIAPTRRLKIGYVSPDFCAHPVAFFLAPLLEAHDHAQFEIYAYANVQKPDAVTERLRETADFWRDVRNISDAELAEIIRRDGIDILVDLTMHAADNRLLAFARKPAPVQVSWLAYPGSTGMEAIDYRLTDAQLEPAGQGEEGHGGQAVRLPDAWCCYGAIEEFPEVSALPAATNGFVTFGSLNQFAKIHGGQIRCWARILAAVPASRILIVCPEGEARRRTRAIFAEHGIAEERVECVAPGPWSDYVRLLERIDLALDTYPCNGMTTTCHALWMGLPIISLAGSGAMSRSGRSLLPAVGFADLVTESEDDYVRVAIEWANDLPRAAEWRAALRPRMRASPLMDAPKFARQVEDAYRAMWRQWCAQTANAKP
jgi:predicted O-linked N-acetylglucosamine transferase (SPINDLY family)